MSLSLKGLLSRVALPGVRNLLGPDVLQLAAIFDKDLVEGDAIRHLAIGVDGGRSLISSKTGWKTLIEVLPHEGARELSKILGLGDSSVYDKLDEFQIDEANEEELNKIFRFFDVPPNNDFREFEKVASAVVVPGYKLFDHQRNPALKVMSVFKSGKSACVLHLPTGGGKTRTSMVVICRWLVENPGTCVVWLAASEELLSQASDEFERAWGFLGDRDASIERVWGNVSLKQQFLLSVLIFCHATEPFQRSSKYAPHSLLLELSYQSIPLMHMARCCNPDQLTRQSRARD